MKKLISKKVLDANGEVASNLLAEKLSNIQGIRVVQTPIKINDLWAIVFDVYLPNDVGHIEFTAMQTGWGGDAFLDLKNQ